MMKQLPHLASRIFGAPLLIEGNKLQAILAAIGPRIGIAAEEAQEPKAYGPGDTGQARKPYFITEDKIAIISILGPLVKRQSGEFLSGGPTTYGEIENEFMDAATDPAIRGILLVIDSPGGESVGAFELSDLIYSQRSEKPIYAVADGDAFSAAYALASAAERLYVTKSGGVGSVGVYLLHVDQSAFNAKLGVKPTYIFSGAKKVQGNAHEPLSDDARETFQTEVDRVYGMFVDTVARNRSMSTAAVRATEAGLFFGENGVGVGFADEIGTFADAMTALRAAIQNPGFSNRSAARAGQRISTQEVPNMPPTQAEAKQDQQVEQKSPPAQGGTAQPGEQANSAAEPSQPSERDSALAYAVEVVELCGLAGLPQMATEFIRAQTSVDDVRKQLQDARAGAIGGSEIQSHVLPETAAQSAPRNLSESPIVRAAERLAQEKERN